MDPAKGQNSQHGRLLAVCSRSIVKPNTIILEANRMLAIMKDQNVDRKFIVEGCEKLSLLAAGFIRSGFDDIAADYARMTGIDHMKSGFESKNELVKYCEYCVLRGEERLNGIRDELMSQLELENGMSEDEIRRLNVKKSGSDLSTVQDRITDYIKLSLLVNSLKKISGSTIKAELILVNYTNPHQLCP
jgi:nitrogenase subunit NifH